MKMHLEVEQRKRWPGQADRKRRKVQFTLSDEARAALERLAPEGARSEFVERLILDAAKASVR